MLVEGILLLHMMTKYHSNAKTVIVGIDPANSGAAVILHDGEVVAAVLWKPCVRKKRKAYSLSISYNNTVQNLTVRTTAHIGHVISNMPFLTSCNAIAIEDCYMSRNAKTAITLAKISASIAAPLEVKSGFPSIYVKPNVWRSTVLSAGGRTKRDVLKAISLSRIPEILPSLKHHMEKLGDHDHITDAAGIALWLIAVKNK